MAEDAGKTSRRHSASDVSLAFGLGWDMTYLFTYVGDRSSELPNVADRLPSLSRLPEKKRSLIRLDRIRGPVSHFKKRFKTTGVTDLPAVDTVEKHLHDGSSRDTVRDELCDLHYSLMRAFSTADNRLAKAYRLGRSLSTTCHIAEDQKTLEQEFDPNRLARLDEWLADLASQLPPHSSRPVRLSLSAWRDWISEPHMMSSEHSDNWRNVRAGLFRRPILSESRNRLLDWSKDGENVSGTLKRQGDIWRALLSGEKRGDAMLELPDFISAAMKVPRRTLKLLNVIILPVAVSVTLICLGAVLAISDDGLLQEIVGVGSIALGLVGTIGFTWQGALGSIRKSATEIKTPLWGAVLDEEIARAITEEPVGAVFKQEEAAIAAPAVGPVPVG